MAWGRTEMVGRHRRSHLKLGFVCKYCLHLDLKIFLVSALKKDAVRGMWVGIACKLSKEAVDLKRVRIWSGGCVLMCIRERG